MHFSIIRTPLLLSCIPILSFLACTSKKPENTAAQSVVIATEGDVDSFNPLFAEEVTAGEINDLLFPGLVGSEFNETTGTLTYTPMLARSWEYTNGDRDVVFHLLTRAVWSDGVPIRARDVQLSYELYGDPEIASVRQSAVEGLRRTEGMLDVSKSVEVINDSTVVFHFEQPYPAQLFDAGLPILPAHVFEGIPRKELRTHPINKAPVASGPFSLRQWEPLQEIVLETNKRSTVPRPARLENLVFRVLPDYHARVSQLRAGQVDLLAGIRIEEAAAIERENPSLQIISTAGRDYDFIGWNNIDPQAYGSAAPNLRPHPLFGSPAVRRALTMSINREELTRAYLGTHGQQATGGVSPLFRWAFNDTINPLPYSPVKALDLLGREGWKDSNGDGVLDKGGRSFSFVLKIPSGNQLRMTVASVVQQQLRSVNIEVNLEQVERGAFWEGIMARNYDAWIAGFSVPLQMQLDDLWGSDLEKYPFNVTGFRNARVDQIFQAARTLTREADGASLWKEFQVIVHEQQPCTFLFWINNIVGVSKKIGGTDIGALGTTHKAWDWHVMVSDREVALRAR